MKKVEGVIIPSWKNIKTIRFYIIHTIELEEQETIEAFVTTYSYMNPSFSKKFILESIIHRNIEIKYQFFPKKEDAFLDIGNFLDQIHQSNLHVFVQNVGFAMRNNPSKKLEAYLASFVKEPKFPNRSNFNPEGNSVIFMQESIAIKKRIFGLF